jgi:hypothetical protein
MIHKAGVPLRPIISTTGVLALPTHIWDRKVDNEDKNKSRFTVTEMRFMTPTVKYTRVDCKRNEDNQKKQKQNIHWTAV